MTYTSVLHIGNKHQELIRLLDFYQKEVGFLETLLAEVVAKNTAQEILAEAEHFQNQFFIQKRNISEYHQQISVNNALTSIDVKDHAGKVDERLVSDIERTEAEVLTFEKIVIELRQDFKQFLVKWM